MRLAVFLGIFLALPGPAGAQVEGADPPATRVGSSAAILLKAGQIAGADRYFLGGWGGLVFGDHFVLGGGGLALTEDVELPGSEFSTGFDLGFGYGGLFLRYWDDFSHLLTGEAGLFLGAGHAEVRDRLAGREVGSDNFLVVEPEASLFCTVLPYLHLGISGGYRMVFGVEDLPRVSADDLQSFTGTLSLRLGGR
jgi:hypothetical protein